MKKIETVSEMRAFAAKLRADEGQLSLVPTMGALHGGHEALIRAAMADGGPVVVVIFANPLSFGPSESFVSYPKSLESDVELCRCLGVAAVFAPSADEVYPRGFSTYVTEEALSATLCGISRPNHFRGVATWLVKMLNIMAPTRLYVGQKDSQHVAVIRKIAADLAYEVRLVVVPTVRESDGVAISVRNRELSPTQRQDAVALSRALKRAREMVESGVRSNDRLIAEATHILGQHRRIRVIYASIVDLNTMEPIREVVPGRALMAIAAWVDEVRLTDSALL